MASFSCHFLAREPEAFDGAILCQRITLLESHSEWLSGSTESSHAMAYPGQILNTKISLGYPFVPVLIAYL
jgi:hypothetical protein